MSTVEQYKAHVRAFGTELVVETASADRQLTEDEKSTVVAFAKNADKKVREVARAAKRERRLRVKAMTS